MAYLAILDRAYRGTAEAQFFDALYGALVLGGSLGGMDVVLRGTAVSAAVDRGDRPVLRLASVELDVLPDHRGVLAAMVGAGRSVWADEADLAALGLADAPLVPGVRRCDTTGLAVRWGDYDGVWFL